MNTLFNTTAFEIKYLQHAHYCDLFLVCMGTVIFRRAEHRFLQQKSRTYKVKYPETLDQATVFVLQSMSLINDDTAPVYGSKQLQVRQDDLVRSNKCVKLVEICDLVPLFIPIVHLVLL